MIIVFTFVIDIHVAIILRVFGHISSRFLISGLHRISFHIFPFPDLYFPLRHLTR